MHRHNSTNKLTLTSLVRRKENDLFTLPRNHVSLLKDFGIDISDIASNDYEVTPITTHHRYEIYFKSEDVTVITVIDLALANYGQKPPSVLVRFRGEEPQEVHSADELFNILIRHKQRRT
jgi:hypothetical protein